MAVMKCPTCKGVGKIKQRECEQCGKPSGRALYCSDACYWNANPPDQDLIDQITPDEDD